MVGHSAEKSVAYWAKCLAGSWAAWWEGYLAGQSVAGSVGRWVHDWAA